MNSPIIFVDLAGSEVKFDEHGDGLARYEILNFRKANQSGTNGYYYRVSGNNSIFIFQWEKIVTKGSRVTKLSENLFVERCFGG